MPRVSPGGRAGASGEGVSQNVANCRTRKKILTPADRGRPARALSQNVPECRTPKKSLAPEPLNRARNPTESSPRPAGPAVTFRATTGPAAGVHWQRVRGPRHDPP